MRYFSTAPLNRAEYRVRGAMISLGRNAGRLRLLCFTSRWERMWVNPGYKFSNQLLHKNVFFFETRVINNYDVISYEAPGGLHARWQRGSRENFKGSPKPDGQMFERTSCCKKPARSDRQSRNPGRYPRFTIPGSVWVYVAGKRRGLALHGSN